MATRAHVCVGYHITTQFRIESHWHLPFGQQNGSGFHQPIRVRCQSLSSVLSAIFSTLYALVCFLFFQFFGYLVWALPYLFEIEYLVPCRTRGWKPYGITYSVAFTKTVNLGWGSVVLHFVQYFSQILTRLLTQIHTWKCFF